MKAITKNIGLTVIVVFLALATNAQRTITGIIYNSGEPAAGILVEAHRSNDSYYTSFDGKYEIEVSEKSKWLRFTFLDDSKKIDIRENKSKVINFSWDGSEIPSSDEEAGVILKTLDELRKDRDMDFLNNYSLYREFFKQGDYKSALPNWRKVYKTYPKSTTQIYRDGLEMMESFLVDAMNTDIKKAYLDTMMQIYDKRIKYLDSKGELLGRKAADYLEKVLTLDIPEDELIKDIKKGYGFAEKSMEESGVDTEPAVIVLFMQSTRRLFTFNEFSSETVLENYEKAMNLLEKQVKNKETEDKAEQAIPLVEQILEGSGAMDCETMLKLYKSKFRENPEDIELIKKALRAFEKADCENTLIVEMSEQLYELEPSAEAAFNMARMFLKKEKYPKAFNYYEKAYNLATNNEDKALYYYEAAGLALQQGDLEKSRDLAKKAVGSKSDYCEAYMLLGEVYAQASKGYSDSDFERSTVFWLATDYFKKAAQYPNCKSDAQSKIKFYQNYFPNKEDVFFNSLEIGKNYYIGGWINETTTVRAKEK
ncbi:MAG TPA: tetratricopeptide repeat protein [Prolixibacteraceae bacterium]|nr:tetratricopeptide repeat protein [Prolixibacteraceae bacterium]